MALQYKPSKYAFDPGDKTIVEQEHKASCDINKMILAAKRGQLVRGGPAPRYGVDDTNLTKMDVLIAKEAIEREIAKSEKDLDSDLFDRMSPAVQKTLQKFGFRSKKSEQKPAAKNDELNDEKMPGKSDDKKQTANTSNEKGPA